jgi:hypothetical protein
MGRARWPSSFPWRPLGARLAVDEPCSRTTGNAAHAGGARLPKHLPESLSVVLKVLASRRGYTCLQVRFLSTELDHVAQYRGER